MDFPDHMFLLVHFTSPVSFIFITRPDAKYFSTFRVDIAGEECSSSLAKVSEVSSKPDEFSTQDADLQEYNGTQVLD